MSDCSSSSSSSSDTEDDSEQESSLKNKSDTEQQTDSGQDSSDDDNEIESGISQPLITFQRREDIQMSLQVHVEEEVLNDVLKSCMGKPICCLSMLGLPGTGKSYMLNLIKEQLRAKEYDKNVKKWFPTCKMVKGFAWKHSIRERTTKGIYIWSKAFFVTNDDDEEVAVLLLDTQGISEELEDDIRLAILGISLLLSSVTLINAAADIPAEIVDWIHVLTKYGRLCAKQGVTESYQKLTFVIRDWTRVSNYSFGANRQDGFTNDLLEFQKKDAKKLFKSCWPEIESYFFPHIGRKALLPEFCGQSQMLSSEFRRHTETFLTELTDAANIKIKRFFGNDGTSKCFKAFLQSYVAVFNDQHIMELGLKPEHLWNATLKAAIEMKVNNALDAYVRVFQERTELSGYGYLKQSVFHDLSNKAYQEAMAAVQTFKVPNQYDSQAVDILKSRIKTEREKLEADHKSLMKIHIEDELCASEKSLHDTLQTQLPVDEHHLFYEEPIVAEKVTSLLGATKEIFLENFECENLSEEEDLARVFDQRLEVITEAFRDTNMKLEIQAKEKASNMLEDFVFEYISNMQQLLEKLPSMDVKTFNIFHEKETSDINKKIAATDFGNVAFTQRWHSKVFSEIEKEKKKILLSLDSVLSELRSTNESRIQSYETELRRQLECENEDLTVWHNLTIEEIIAEAEESCPYPVDDDKRKTLCQGLRQRLELTFNTLFDEMILRKTEDTDFLHNASKNAVTDFENGLLNLLEDKHFLAKDELDKLILQLRETTNVEFAHSIATLTLPQEHIKIVQNELNTKYDTLAAAYILRNEETQASHEGLAEAERNRLLQIYDTTMSSAIRQFKTIEDLENEHQSQKQQITDVFKTSVSSKNTKFVQTNLRLLETSIDTKFLELEEYFATVKQAKDAALMTALLEVQTEYIEYMNSYFLGKTGAFTNIELEKLHKDARIRAESKLPKRPMLTKDQQLEVVAKLDEVFQKYKTKNELVYHSFCDGEPAIGVDLGTTYSCVSIFLQGKVHVIRNESSGDTTTPSYVRMGNSDLDPMVFGQTAKDLAYRFDPDKTIYDAKRLIGRRMDDPNVIADLKIWPFTVMEKDGGPQIRVNGKYYYPEQISSFILGNLKSVAEQWLGRSISKAVITVPAYFTDAQRQATAYAGELAGFTVLGLLNEPTSAAIAYRLDNMKLDKPQNVLVYDLGGGTFDVAILSIQKNTINVLAVEGDSHLGGEDFDNRLMIYCAQEFQKTTGVDIFAARDSPDKNDRDDARRNIRRLQTACEAAKKALSTALIYRVSIDSFAKTALLVEIRRKTFEDLNEPLFRDTIKTVAKALKSANLEKSAIDDIVLVGGSTKIPLVKKLLQEFFDGKALSVVVDADHAVAQGAAVHAAMLCAVPNEASVDFAMLNEITPMALGVEMANKEFDPIIPKGTKIPTAEKQIYYTFVDNQETASIRIFQGEHVIAEKNKLLGDFDLMGIPPGKAHEQSFEVTMKIDNSGILSVEAVCVGAEGTKIQMTVFSGRSPLRPQKSAKQTRAVAQACTEICCSLCYQGSCRRMRLNEFWIKNK